MRGPEGDQPKIKAPINQGLMQTGFFFLVLLSLLSPFMILSDLPGMGESSPVRQISYIIVLAMIAVAARPDSDLSRLQPVPWPILVALGWCWLSFVWAIDKGAAFRHLFLTTLVLWSIFLCVAHLKFEQLLLLVRIALVLLVILNYVVLLINPAFAIHQSNDMVESKLAGDWRGMMMHKNYAGALMAMTILFFTFHARPIWFTARLAIIAAAAFFLLHSTSKTSCGMVITALAVGFLMRHYRFRYRPLLVCLLIIAGSTVAVLNFVYFNPLKQHWSNPDMFTGRTLIWDMMIRYWEDHPWLGSGFGSFWNIGDNSPVYSYTKGWVTTIGTGHNGYLDLLVQTGIIGAVLVVGACMIWPLFRVLLGKSNSGERAAVLTAVMVFCIGHNFTESSIFDRDAIINVFLLLTVAFILKGESRSKRPLSGFFHRRRTVPA